jgi:YggT family protein
VSIRVAGSGQPAAFDESAARCLLPELTLTPRGDTISLASYVPDADLTKGSTPMVFLFNILSFLLLAMQIAIIARALFSWFDPTGRTPIGAILITITDPIIVPIRRLLPSAGFMDFSPLVALLIIFILRTLLSSTFQPTP